MEKVSDSDLHLSAVTIAEIQAGIEITRARNTAKATEVEAWLCQVETTFNVLAMDARALRRWGTLMHGKSDSHQGSLIATLGIESRFARRRPPTRRAYQVLRTAEESRSAGPGITHRRAMIAATAGVNRLIVVTRSVRHIVPFCVRTLNPFSPTLR